jgi:hypothetical protein
MQPDLSYLNEDEGANFLKKVYRHWVFYYHRNNWRKEMKEQGKVTKDIRNSNTSERMRKVSPSNSIIIYLYNILFQLAGRREDQCKLEGLPVRIQRLFSEASCVSDDEEHINPVTHQVEYIVKLKPARSSITTVFAKLVDERRLATLAQNNETDNSQPRVRPMADAQVTK